MGAPGERDLADEWYLHREQTVDSLRGIPVPIDSIDVWQQQTCDELGWEDLVLPDTDVAFTGISWKLPDAWEVQLGS